MPRSSVGNRWRAAAGLGACGQYSEAVSVRDDLDAAIEFEGMDSRGSGALHRPR